MMKPLARIRRLISSSKGAALVEYGMLVGLIAVLSIFAVSSVGERNETVFCTVTKELARITSFTPDHCVSVLSANDTLSIQAPEGTPLQGLSIILDDGDANQAYSYDLSPFVTVNSDFDTAPSWAVSGGALPPGLSLSEEGIISGTPTSSYTTPFTLEASLPNGASADQSFVIRVAPPLTISVVDLNQFVTNTAGFGYIGRTGNPWTPSEQQLEADRTCESLFGNVAGFTRAVDYDWRRIGANNNSFPLYRVSGPNSVAYISNLSGSNFANSLFEVTCEHE